MVKYRDEINPFLQMRILFSSILKTFPDENKKIFLFKKEGIKQKEILSENRENQDKVKTVTQIKTQLETEGLGIEINKNAVVLSDSFEFSKEKCSLGTKFENLRFPDKQKLKTIGLGDKMHPQVRKVEIWNGKGMYLGIAERKGIAGGFYYSNGEYAKILDGYSAKITEVDDKIEETIAKKEKEFDEKYKGTFDKIEDSTEVDINGTKKQQRELVYEMAKKYGIDPSFLFASQVTENGSEYSLAEYTTRLNMEARRIQHALTGYEAIKGNPLEKDGTLSLEVIAAFSARYSFDESSNDHLERLVKKYSELSGKKFDMSEENMAALKKKYEILRHQSNLELDPHVKEEYEKFAKEMHIDVNEIPDEKKFYILAKAAAQKIEELTGLPWRVTVAQATLETGNGKHIPNNNCFGIKGRGEIQKTAEYENGSYRQVNASFRTYDSIFDSFYDYAKLIMTSQRYSRIIEQYKNGNITSSRDILARIIKAGYATSPTYVQNAESALNSHGESLNDQIAYNSKYEIKEGRSEFDVAKIPIDEKSLETKLSQITSVAESQEGINEKQNSKIIQEYHESGGLNANAETPWCASFVNYVVNEVGFKGPLNPASAKNWETWGQHAEIPKEGCIVLLKRHGGSGRHVGFYAGETPDGKILIRGGNQDNEVNVKEYPKSRIVDYRIPTQNDIFLA